MKRRLKIAGAAVLVGGTLLLAGLGDPGPELMLRHWSAALDARLAAGEVQVEPAELLHLLHDRAVRLRVVDLRDEAAWNWFHLLDSERVEADRLAGWAKDVDYDEIVVLVDEDGARSPEAWRRLQAAGVANSYLLDGGARAWLEQFGGDRRPTAALGDRHPASLPAAHEGLDYTSRVRRVGRAPVLSGGCG